MEGHSELDFVQVVPPITIMIFELIIYLRLTDRFVLVDFFDELFEFFQVDHAVAVGVRYREPLLCLVVGLIFVYILIVLKLFLNFQEEFSLLFS